MLKWLKKDKPICDCESHKLLCELYKQLHPGYSSILDFSKSRIPEKIIYKEFVNIDFGDKTVATTDAKIRKLFDKIFHRIYREDGKPR